MTPLVILLFIINFENCYGVIYKLNDSEYRRMPVMFKFDNYEDCVSKPNGLYCTTNFDLISDEPNPLYDLIVEYSKHTTKHYNHTKLLYGVCVSDNCNHTLTTPKLSLEVCLNESFEINYGLKTRAQDVFCSNDDRDREIDTSDIIVGILCIFCIAVNVIGSFYDVCIKNTKEETKWYHCFSIRRNWYKLVTTEDSNPQFQHLKCLNGTRGLFTCLVILPHTSMPMYFWHTNSRFLEKLYDNIGFYLLLNGTLVIQVFIILSGLLLVYNLQIREEIRSLSWKSVPELILLRWLRLTPAYAFILAITSTWMRHLRTGPIWHELVESEIQDCRKYWWHHLLYIQNYSTDSNCLVQSWYIAVDMQLFILGLIVYFVCRTKRSREIILPVLFLIGILITAAHTYFEDLDGNVMSTPEVIIHQVRKDQTFLKVYRRSHTNIPCYILGLGTGYMIYYWKKNNVNFDNLKKRKVLSWIIGPVLLLLSCIIIIIGAFFYKDAPRSSILLRTLYAASSKPLMGIMVASVFIGMIMGVDRFCCAVTERGWWRILARLSYSAYTLHVTLIRYTTALSMGPSHVSFMTMVQYYLYILILTFLLSVPIWLFIESPMNQLLKLYLSPANTRNEKKKIESDLETQDLEIPHLKTVNCM